LTPLKVDDPLAPDADEPFIPPKVWTAWPLPSDQVPRTNETIGEEDPDEFYTFKRREEEYPSRELEDILTGITIRSARNRFEARETASEFIPENVSAAEDDNDSVSEDQGYAEDNLDVQNDDLDNKSKAEPQAVLIPAPSLDDESSAKLVRPNIRYTLTKLDELLTALHHARVNCHRFSSLAEADSSGNPIATGDDTIPEKQPKGRPRKFQNLAYRSKTDVLGMEEKFGNEEILRPKMKPGRGRKPTQYPRLDGEPDRDYQVRIARLQKKPLPAFAPPLHGNEPNYLEQPMGKPFLPRIKKDPAKAVPERFQKLKLRDWSEVLGTAGLVGFSPEVIAKATQRCANLFGEGMIMTTLVEAPFGVSDTSHNTIYEPEEIPDFSSALPLDDSQAREREIESPEFEDISDETAKSGGPSDEEMDGAVHVDRFLKLPKRLLRGPDKKSRKRRRRRSNNAFDDDGGDYSGGSDLDEVLANGSASGLRSQLL
jgi:hypothetical protein